MCCLKVVPNSHNSTWVHAAAGLLGVYIDLVGKKIDKVGETEDRMG